MLNQRNGFSILEILFAIFIVSLLAAAALQKYAGSLRKIEYETHLTETVGILNLARDYAKTMNKEILVSFNMTGNRLNRVVLSHKTSTLNIIEKLDIEQEINVSLNPLSDGIIFSPTRSIKLGPVNTIGEPQQLAQNI